MSIRCMTKVWDGFPGAGTDLLTLLALADWSDDDGRCFPSMASIAAKTRLSRSQAQRVVHRLIAEDFVSVIGNETGGPPGSTRQYRINLNALTGSTGATPTGRIDATGSTSATGRMDAQEGPHGCGETGRTDATQTVSEPSLTVKHSKRAKKSAIAADFQISARVETWAAEKGFDRLDEHLEAFKAKCAAKGYVYADHDAAFMEAIRTDWAGLRKPQAPGKRVPAAEGFGSKDYGQGGLL